jgi:hypothetical protein
VRILHGQAGDSTLAGGEVNRYRGHTNSGFRHLGAVSLDCRLDKPIDIRQDEDEHHGNHDCQRTGNDEDFSAAFQNYTSLVPYFFYDREVSGYFQGLFGA